MGRLPPLRLSGVAIGCLLIAIFAVGLRPNTDPDLWWHLATGRYMLAHHAIPSHDVFSLTARSHRWITHEWLTELLFYRCWQLGGAPLLSLLTACIITCTFAVVYATAGQRGVPTLLGVPVVGLAALVAAHTWGTGTRPQMFSLLFCAVYALALVRMVRRREAAPPAWFPLLMALWVNMHGGFVFGLALLALATTGYAGAELARDWMAPSLRGRRWSMARALDARTVYPAASPSVDDQPWDDPAPARRKRSLNLRRCAAVLAATALATLINPNGLAGALYPLSYLGKNASTRYVQEWMPPDFHQLSYRLFAALVALLALGALANLRRLRPADWLVLLPFTYLAFQSVRNIGLFAVLAAPLVAELLTTALPLFRTRPARRRMRPTPAKVALNWLCVLAMAVGVGLAIAPSVDANAQVKAQARNFPLGALAYIDRYGLPARGFDSYEWGGYLIWRWYPARSVYVDGRPDMYGDRYIDRYVNALRAGPGWRELLRANALCYVLVQPTTGIARALATERRWILRYRDGGAVLYQAPARTPGCPAP